MLFVIVYDVLYIALLKFIDFMEEVSLNWPTIVHVCVRE